MFTARFKLFLVFFLILTSNFGANVFAKTQDINGLDSFNRYKISLNGQWRYIVDPYENGFYNYRWQKFDDQEYPSKNAFFTDSKVKSKSELLEYDFDEASTIKVPSDWNTQDERLYFYEGTVWYRKEFNKPEQTAGDRLVLRFGAVNYRADVYLNGKKLGVHLGGFTPFFFDITDAVKAGINSLVVKVDNKRGADEVPTLNTDWWNYGGITRDVDLIPLPKQFIQHYQSTLDSVKTKSFDVKVKLSGSQIQDTDVVMAIPELNLVVKATTDKEGVASFNTNLPEFTPWSPTNPKLYDIKFSTEFDELKDTIGLRTIETKDKDILLNGEKIFLKGVSLHEEYAVDGGGRVKNAEQARYLLNKVKELNANYVRLAHYPHSESAVRIAEELGLLVWSEIPVYWTINWTNEATYKKAEQQLTEMIVRDRNRAAVVIWSIANETPVTESRTVFLSRLAKEAEGLDGSRLISAAMEKHYDQEDENLAIVSDPLSDIVDIVSFNQYIGWYEGLSKKLERTRWHIPYNKPVIISEFGAGAVQGMHGDKTERWTEEFQAEVYDKTFKMLDAIDGWSGVSPWILMDFRSPRRIHGKFQKDFNRKGLMSPVGEKKKAFDSVKLFYNKVSD
ncbi:beta-glucuronidase [Alteromonas sp. 5E99-2]|nr:beta-glucuronidase [Alteromonas sp. 5E99-2]